MVWCGWWEVGWPLGKGVGNALPRPRTRGDVQQAVAVQRHGARGCGYAPDQLHQVVKVRVGAVAPGEDAAFVIPCLEVMFSE